MADPKKPAARRPRTRTVMNVDKTDAEVLSKLARSWGCTGAAALRRVIREAHEAFVQRRAAA